ncbi:glycosyltransferase family 2 protein [Lacinutrix undariae]
MQDPQILLSITLATYNVQDFIQESLDSILSQSFKDFELICIDDASQDNTAQIIKSYAQKDDRITLIVKPKNEGLAVARNASLALAKGKYVTFLDGDDIYDTTLFEKAVALAEQEQSDMVLWDYVTFYDNKDLNKLKTEPSSLLNFNVKDKKALLKRPAFTWVKLLRTEKARTLNIHFPVGYTRQDIPVHWHLVTELEKVSVLPERLAYYRQQPDATTAKKDSKLFHLVYVMDIVEKKLKTQGLFKQYKETFYTQQLNFFQGMYDNIQDSYKVEALSLIKSRLSDTHLQFLNSTKQVRPQTKYFLKSIKGDTFATIQYHVWQMFRKVYRTLKK